MSPQHIRQGEVTLPLLETLRIDYGVLPDDLEAALDCLDKAAETMRNNHCPYALVVRKDTFEPYSLQRESARLCDMEREDAVKTFVDGIGPRDVVVSTTGKTSRELFEHRSFSIQDSHNEPLQTES